MRSRASGGSWGLSSPAVKRRDHVQLASSGDRRAPRQVDRAQLDGRTGQGAHDRGRVGRVGQHSQPGEHVANLRPLKERGVPGEPEGDRALLERGRHEPRFAPSRSDDQADLLRANLPGREQVLDLPRGGLRLGPLAGAAPEANPLRRDLAFRSRSVALRAPRAGSTSASPASSGSGSVASRQAASASTATSSLAPAAPPCSQAADGRCCPCHGGRRSGGGGRGRRARPPDGAPGRTARGRGRRSRPGGSPGPCRTRTPGFRARQPAPRSAFDGRAPHPRARPPSRAESARRARPARRSARGRGGRARSRGRRRPGCRSPAGRGRGWRRSRRTHARGSRARAPATSDASRSVRSAQSRSWAGVTLSAFIASIRRSSLASSPAGLPRISCRRSERSSRRSRSIARRSAARTVAKNGSSPASNAYSRSSRSAAAS